MSLEFIKALKRAGIDGISAAADSASLRGYLGSGNFALNWIISGKFFGGWPLGHVAEIFGDPSTGKSFIVARAVAEALKGQGVAILDDTESAFNPVWASAGLGVDTSRLAYSKSHTIEDHHELVMAMISAMKSLKVTDPSLIALDSLALLSTRTEVEGGMEKTYMKRAQDIKKHYRLACHELSNLPVAYLVANHNIANIGDIYNPKTQPGGGGTKFQSSVRIEMRTPKKMKDAGGQYIGVKVTAFTDKNRLVPPWRKADIIIPFYQAISPVSGLIALLLDLKVLEKTGNHKLVFQGADTGVAANSSDLWKQEASAMELLTKIPTLLQDLEKMDIGKRSADTQMKEEGAQVEEEDE